MPQTYDNLSTTPYSALTGTTYDALNAAEGGEGCPTNLTFASAGSLTFADLLVDQCTFADVGPVQAPQAVGTTRSVDYSIRSRATQNRALSYDISPFSVATQSSTETLNTQNHDIVLPAGATLAGDILLVVMAIDGNPTVTLPAGGGYTLLLDQANGTDYKMVVFWKRAVGGEGNTILTTPGVNEQSATHVYRIRGAHSTSAPEIASIPGSSNNPNPPNLNPAGWAQESEYSLFVAASAISGATLTVSPSSGYPANYTGGIYSGSGGTATSGVNLTSARRDSLAPASGEDPGTFTLSAARAHTAATIAIRGAAPASQAVGITRGVLYDLIGRATSQAMVRYEVRFRATPSPAAVLFNIANRSTQTRSVSYQVLQNVLPGMAGNLGILVRFNISGRAQTTRGVGYSILFRSGTSRDILYDQASPPEPEPEPLPEPTYSDPWGFETIEETERAMLRGHLGQIEFTYRMYRSDRTGERLQELKTVENASFSLDNFRDHTWELSLPMDAVDYLDIWGDWVRLDVEIRAAGYEVSRSFGHYYFTERGGADSPHRRRWELSGKSAEARLMGSTAHAGYSAAAGTGVLANVRQILLDQGVPSNMIMFPPQSAEVLLGTTLFFDPFQSNTDTRWLRICNLILAAGGFISLFADNEGRLNTRAVNSSNRIEAAHTYGTNGDSDHMITSDEMTYKHDEENFANRVVVYSGDPAEAASYGVAENHDPNSRISYERLGYWKQADPIELPSLVSPAEAQAVALQALRVASGVNLTRTFETNFDTRIKPRQAYGLEVFDDYGVPIVTGDVWTVMTVSASLDLSPMQHEVMHAVSLANI